MPDPAASRYKSAGHATRLEAGGGAPPSPGHGGHFLKSPPALDGEGRSEESSHHLETQGRFAGLSGEDLNMLGAPWILMTKSGL